MPIFNTVFLTLLSPPEQARRGGTGLDFTPVQTTEGSGHTLNLSPVCFNYFCWYLTVALQIAFLGVRDPNSSPPLCLFRPE